MGCLHMRLGRLDDLSEDSGPSISHTPGVFNLFENLLRSMAFHLGKDYDVVSEK